MKVQNQLGFLFVLSILAACGGGGGGGSTSDELHLGGSSLAMPFWQGGLEPVQGKVVLMVNEAAQASLDLNTDGDFGDNVAFLFDPATGVSTNLGVSIDFTPVAAGRFVGWRLSEFSEGQTDFNGDMVTNDAVLAVFDTEAPVGPGNPMITSHVIPPGGTIRSAGSRFILALFEGDVGDQNGDMDASDTLIASYDPSTSILNVCPRAWGGGIAIDDAQVALTVSEMFDGMLDLNGDMDTGDNVLFLFRADTGAVIPVLGGAPNPRAVAPIFSIANNRIVAFLDEAAEGATNFNAGFAGDNDATDFILIAFNLGPMTSVLPSGGLACQPTSLIVKGDYAAVVSRESDSGNGAPPMDFNADGDDGDDVPHWIDLANPTLAHNLGVAASSTVPALRLCDDYLLFQASEGDQGSGTNYNGAFGDTDTGDEVTAFFALNIPGAPVRFTGLDANDTVCFEGEQCFFLSASETENGSFDLNLDGDSNDIVPVYFRVASGLFFMGQDPIPTDGPIAIQITPNCIRVFGNATESNGFGDLNEDGDTDDYGIIATRISRSTGEVESFRAVFSSDTDGMSFPIVIDADTVVFPFAEEKIGTGRNGNALFGDVDTNDLLLYFVNTSMP